ncbi:MAG: hypothetical protein KDJ38_00200 [Gammaproteobacteria bacterium]|nr:hypothetical protein [Gammaproteobacteria bacterium]
MRQSMISIFSVVSVIFLACCNSPSPDDGSLASRDSTTDKQTLFIEAQIAKAQLEYQNEFPGAPLPDVLSDASESIVEITLTAWSAEKLGVPVKSKCGWTYRGITRLTVYRPAPNNVIFGADSFTLNGCNEKVPSIFNVTVFEERLNLQSNDKEYSQLRSESPLWPKTSHYIGGGSKSLPAGYEYCRIIVESINTTYALKTKVKSQDFCFSDDT